MKPSVNTIQRIVSFIQTILLVTLSFVSDHYALSLPSTQYGKDAFNHQHIFGSDGNFTLNWKVNWDTKSLIFNVSAECKGYIGLGLSKTGSIVGSDFVIGGIDSNNTSYFSDMHGIANGTLQHDYRNDYTLIDVQRRDGRIYLSFSRPFETCDEEDYQVSGDLVHVIWAYGDTDETTLFSPHHGNETFYLLDPDFTTKMANQIYREIGPHSNLYLMQRWRGMARQKVPESTDSQFCSIIKGPQLNFQHYILGGGAYIPSSRKSGIHVQQIVLSRCVAPDGQNVSLAFDPLVKQEGQECSSLQNSSLIPRFQCTEIIFVWTKGGKPFYFPEEYGIPIGISQREYYLLEVHYHNPNNLKEVVVEPALDLMFHPRPRTYEVGMHSVGYSQSGLFTIPPRSASFSVYGHCSSQCTKDTFPNDGFEVVAVLLQMHALGKSIRLRHFRGAVELPWILNDENYKVTFQQTRLLYKPVSIFPGDHLTVQCTYNTSTVSNTTFSGFSNDQEICSAYLVINKRISSAWCSSEYSADNQLQYLGIQNIQRNTTIQKGIATDREKLMLLAGKNTLWAPSSRAALQREMLHGLQISSCPTYQQVARYSSAKRFPIIPIRRRKAQNINSPASAYAPSFPTSSLFATNSVTIPNISQEYRPTSECQKNSASANNFGYHRNVITSKFKPLTPTTPNNLSPRVSSKGTIRDRLRRVNG